MAGTGRDTERGSARGTACVLAGALALSACAGGGRAPHPAPAADRLEVLTNFTLALSKRDFEAAASMLVEEERAGLRGPDGKVPDVMKERLRAMRKSTLVRNPMVTLEGGRIRGIYPLIPVLDQDTSAPIAPLSEDVDSVREPPAEAAAVAPGDAALRDLSGRFFRSLRAREWKKALALVDPGERQAFLRGDGGMKEAARLRLLAIDTSAWQALTIEDGKLAGVVLIIPARVPQGNAAATLAR